MERTGWLNERGDGAEANLSDKRLVFRGEIFVAWMSGKKFEQDPVCAGLSVKRNEGWECHVDRQARSNDDQ